MKPRGRGVRALLSLAIVLTLFGVAGAAVYGIVTYRPTTQDVVAGQPVHVVIASGSTTAEIAELLSELGVIENAMMFRLQTRLDEADGKLMAGEYDLATRMPYDAVLQRLLTGPEIVSFDVTIPEGFTARQVAERFASKGGVSADEMMALVTTGADEFVTEHPYLEGAHGGSLEGFLFPATYTITEETSARDAVEMMLDHFDEQVATIDLTVAESKDLDIVAVVTIASILEREAQLSDEFPLVSSVIYNRLARPMRLQLCATVMYTMPAGTTKLTNADLETNSPYNTYLHDGLPVGPISNPGLAALQAAAAPADTDYYYYVLTGQDGSQTFAETYDQFLAAKAVSQRVFGN